MLSTSRLEILNSATRLASLVALVFIAVQLVGLRNAQPQPYRPLTVADFQAVAKDQRAMRDLENRLPMVRVSGNVGVSGTVDVENVFSPVHVKLSGLDPLPVNVTNFQLPVSVANEVRVEVTNRELSTEVTNLPSTLPVRVTNFYDMPRR